MSDRPPLLTVNEAAQYLRVSRRQVYHLINGGGLRSVRVGDRIRLRPGDIDAYLDRPVAQIPVDSTSAEPNV